MAHMLLLMVVAVVRTVTVRAVHGVVRGVVQLLLVVLCCQAADLFFQGQHLVITELGRAELIQLKAVLEGTQNMGVLRVVVEQMAAQGKREEAL